MDGLQCSIQVLRRLKSLVVSALKDPSTWTEDQVFDLGNVIGSLLTLFYRRNILVLLTKHLHLDLVSSWSLSAGLEAAEFASLSPSVFALIRESCIPLIPSTNFAVSTETCCLHSHTHTNDVILSLQSLSPAQLEALGPDNADLVTSKQRAALGEEQLAALERASTGSYEQPQSTETSGKGMRVERCPVSGVSLERIHLQSVFFILAAGAPSLSMEGLLAFTKPLLFLLTGFLLL